MAKGQRRSNREAKKPKQPKSEKQPATTSILVSERSRAEVQKDHPQRRR